jgi:hypothetical protein
MAKIAKKKTKTAGKKKRSLKRKVKNTSLAEDEYSIEKMALLDFAQNTKEDLKHLGDKIHEASDRGVHVAREIAEDVRHFAVNALNLTKVKIDLHNLRAERDSRYSTIGKKLLKLYKADKLSSVKKSFKKDFARLVEIESAISEKEKQEASSSLYVSGKK